MEAVSSPLPSIQERQQIHRKLYEVCRNVFAVYQFQGQSDERLTALVSSLENVVYRSANNKAEYCKALKSRFTLLKARVNAMKRQAIANQTPRSSANNGVTSVEDQIVLSEAEENQQKPVDPAEIKLEEMKQHIPALILVIERIQQLLSNENLSDENRNRLTVQLEKFEKVKKVIQREVTLTCESKLQALELIEQHILPVVNKIYGSPQGLLDTGASSSCIEKEGSGVAFHWETEESGLIGLLKSIGAENLMDSCRQANILSVKQFKALSVEDLQSCFSLSPEEAQRIMSCLSSGVEEAQSIIRQPNVACSTERLYAQMMDHFKCPITQDVINEPVVASDGYTYEKEAISKWLESHNTSPLTGAPLLDRTLRPNFNLQSQIREFCALVASHKSPL